MLAGILRTFLACGLVAFGKEEMVEGLMEDKIREIIAESLGTLPENITDLARFKEDLDADSLDHVEAIMTLEAAFDIEVPDEVAEKLLTVKDAIDLIKEMKS